MEARWAARARQVAGALAVWVAGAEQAVEAGRRGHVAEFGRTPGARRLAAARRVASALSRERGQSTVEFAVVTAGFLAATVALSALWHAFGDGMLVEHALAVASHHLQGVAPTTWADIFLY